MLLSTRKTFIKVKTKHFDSVIRAHTVWVIIRVKFGYHMSHVCNHGTDQSDRRMNIAKFCDLLLLLLLLYVLQGLPNSTNWLMLRLSHMYFWTLDRNLLCQHWIGSFEPCEIVNLRPEADICNLTWLKVSVVFFFRAKKLSLRVLFSSFPCSSRVSVPWW